MDVMVTMTMTMTIQMTAVLTLYKSMNEQIEKL